MVSFVSSTTGSRSDCVCVFFPVLSLPIFHWNFLTCSSCIINYCLIPWHLVTAMAVNALPCRIAFERGKERHFCFLAVSMGTSGWVLLSEELPLKQNYGVVRVSAPLAGTNVSSAIFSVSVFLTKCCRTSMHLIACAIYSSFNYYLK